MFSFFKKKKSGETRFPEFPLFQTIPLPPDGGRQFAIGDVHGCLKSLKALVQQLNLSSKDQLFFLGDYLDRGPDSKGVLDFALSLKPLLHTLVLLKGNHEQMFLDAEERFPDRLAEYARKNKISDMLANERSIDPNYKTLLSNLPYFVSTGNFYLVHAGFDLGSEEPFMNLEQMIWIRNFDPEPEDLKGKRVIHGHTPMALFEIKLMIANKAPAISIDNACVYGKDFEGGGHLLAFELLSEQLFVQANCE